MACGVQFWLMLWQPKLVQGANFGHRPNFMTGLMPPVDLFKTVMSDMHALLYEEGANIGRLFNFCHVMGLLQFLIRLKMNYLLNTLQPIFLSFSPSQIPLLITSVTQLLRETKIFSRKQSSRIIRPYIDPPTSKKLLFVPHSCSHASYVFKTLSKIIKLLVSGTIRADVIAHFCSASLVFKKKEGSLSPILAYF